MAAFHLYCLLFYSFLLKTQQTDMPDDQVAALVTEYWDVDQSSFDVYCRKRNKAAAQQTICGFQKHILDESNGGSWTWGPSITGITIELAVQEVLPEKTSPEKTSPLYRHVLRYTTKTSSSQHILTLQPSILIEFIDKQDHIALKLVHKWGFTSVKFLRTAPPGKSVKFLRTAPPGSWYQWRSLTKCYVEEAVKSFKVTGQHGKLKIFKKWFAKQSVEGQWTNGGYQFILEMALMPKQKKHSYSYYAKHLPDGGAIKCLVPTIKVADDTFTVVFTYLQQQGEITSVGLAYDKAIP
eukprot:GHVS01012608.1.p1 GENE.GHVS01012608.1~~GHVS01012608.1.p1  ORF type:complete len:295 (-),score=23.04 GHVS01012608.1:502-1386(-)